MVLIEEVQQVGCRSVISVMSRGNRGTTQHKIIKRGSGAGGGRGGKKEKVGGKKGRKEGENWLSRSQDQTVNQVDRMSTKLHCSLIV